MDLINSTYFKPLQLALKLVLTLNNTAHTTLTAPQTPLCCVERTQETKMSW